MSRLTNRQVSGVIMTALWRLYSVLRNDATMMQSMCNLCNKIYPTNNRQNRHFSDTYPTFEFGLGKANNL